MPSLSARDYVQAKRGGRATAVRVQPTGTAVTDYQVPLGNRHSLKEAGVIGLPSWSEKSTQNETWVKVPRLSATCPRLVVAFDGGRSAAIDRVMDLFDDFDGAAVDTTKWGGWGGNTTGYTQTGGIFTATGANAYRGIVSTQTFLVNTAVVIRGTTPAGSVDSCGFGFGDGPNKNALFRTHAPLNNGQLNAYTFDTSAHATGLGTSYAGAYHRYEVARNGTTNVRFSIDGAVVATLAYVPTAAANVVAGAYPAGQVVNIDWVLVRKYTANEPLTGTAQPSTTNRALSRPLNHAGLIRACCAA